MTHPTLRWLAVLLSFTFLAAACGGETSSEDDDTDTTTPDDTPPDDSTPDDTTPDSTPGGEGNFYEDPRGGIFAEFQQTFDRSDDPFAQMGTVCVAPAAAPSRDSVASSTRFGCSSSTRACGALWQTARSLPSSAGSC